MAKAAKTKAKALVAVPQSRDEAVRALGTIGDLRRGIDSIKAIADGQIKGIAESAEAQIAPVRDQLTALEAGLQTWCEANRSTLTDGGKVKYAQLGTGAVKWRTRPASVTIKGVEAVIERLKALDLSRFLRVKEEVNKDAMRAEPEIARAVVGVSIGSEGEDFLIEPAELQIEGAA